MWPSARPKSCVEPAKSGGLYRQRFQPKKIRKTSDALISSENEARELGQEGANVGARLLSLIATLKCGLA